MWQRNKSIGISIGISPVPIDIFLCSYEEEYMSSLISDAIKSLYVNQLSLNFVKVNKRIFK